MATRWLVLAMLVGVSVALLPAPGTMDVDVFLKWGDELYRSGFRTGYAAVVGRWEATFIGQNWDLHGGEYPPIGFALLEAVAAIADLLRAAPLLVFNASLLGFTLVSAAGIWAVTRSVDHVLAFFAATLLATAGLGYTDMMTAPFVIAALAEARAGRAERAVVWFVVGVLVKWQVLLLAPFLAIHLLRIDGIGGLTRLVWNRTAWRLLGIVAVIAAIVTALAGVATWTAFANATRHPFLSGTALNLPWLLTYPLLLLRDPSFHWNDEMNFILLSPAGLLPVRLVFAVVMLAVLWCHLRSAKTYANMLFFMVLGVLTYGIWNTAVHENHWFVAVVPAVLLWRETGDRSLFVLVAAMLNVNLFVFYGVTGIEVVSRAAVGFDVTLVLAVLFVAAWAMVFREGWRRQPFTEPVTPAT
jgi:hypothetical protein